jgi:hypothetical protein
MRNGVNRIQNPVPGTGNPVLFRSTYRSLGHATSLLVRVFLAAALTFSKRKPAPALGSELPSDIFRWMTAVRDGVAIRLFALTDRIHE